MNRDEKYEEGRPRISDEELPAWIKLALQYGSGVPHPGEDIPRINNMPYFGAAVFDLSDCRAALRTAEQERDRLRDALGEAVMTVTGMYDAADEDDPAPVALARWARLVAGSR